MNAIQQKLRRQLAGTSTGQSGRSQMFNLLRQFLKRPVADRIEILREAGFTVTEAYSLSQTFNAFCTHLTNPAPARPSPKAGRPAILRGRGRLAA